LKIDDFKTIVYQALIILALIILVISQTGCSQFTGKSAPVVKYDKSFCVALKKLVPFKPAKESSIEHLKKLIYLEKLYSIECSNKQHNKQHNKRITEFI